MTTTETDTFASDTAGAVDVPEADDIAEVRRRDAHATLRRWLAGDHRGNNMYR